MIYLERARFGFAAGALSLALAACSSTRESPGVEPTNPVTGAGGGSVAGASSSTGAVTSTGTTTGPAVDGSIGTGGAGGAGGGGSGADDAGPDGNPGTGLSDGRFGTPLGDGGGVRSCPATGLAGPCHA